MKSLNIMIVEDSLIMIAKLSKMLTEIGHTVVATARTGEEAVVRFDEIDADMITMDIAMPGMNGIETMKKILEKDPNSIIIMVTSHGQEQMVINSISSGAKGYVMKPINIDRLKEMVEKVYEKYGDNI